MTLLFFLVIAPLLECRTRRGIAFAFGFFAEVFSVLPFGVSLGMFVAGALFIEMLERNMSTHEPAGWAAAAASAIGAVAFLHALALIIFEAIALTLAIALFISELLIGLLVIAFLWIPIKTTALR